MLLCKLPDFLEVRKCHDQNCLSFYFRPLVYLCYSVVFMVTGCVLQKECIDGRCSLANCINPAMSWFTKTKLFIFSQASLGYLLL